MAILDICAAIRCAPATLRVSANTPASAMWLARRVAEFPGKPINAIVEDDPGFGLQAIDLAIVNVKLGHERPGAEVLFR